jgi:GNAT superfamily N-acetyltransferase
MVMRGNRHERRRIEFLWDLKDSLPHTKFRDDVIVRLAKRKDEKSLGEMIVEAYLPEWSWWVRQVGGKERARADLMTYVRDFVRHPGKHVFVSEVENAIAGLCGAAKYGSRTGTIGYGVAVSPRHRGGGIGSMLLFSALDWLKRSKVRFATLEEETFSYKNKDAPAVSLYRKFGGLIIRDE